MAIWQHLTILVPPSLAPRLQLMMRIMLLFFRCSPCPETVLLKTGILAWLPSDPMASREKRWLWAMMDPWAGTTSASEHLKTRVSKMAWTQSVRNLGRDSIIWIKHMGTAAEVGGRETSWELSNPRSTCIFDRIHMTPPSRTMYTWTSSLACRVSLH